MTAGSKGVWVALANLAVVALAVACADAERARDIVPIATFTWLFAFVPGIVCGVVVGAVAGRIADFSAGVRLAVLAPLPLALVIALGIITDHARLVPWAFVPTAAAVSILERWTRRRAAPAVPPARAGA
jgi:hypothetical protein